MIEYIRDHWVQYLIGATIAALLGLGLSFYLGQKWSTPESVRAQRIEEERRKESELDGFQPSEAPGDIDINSVDE